MANQYFSCALETWVDGATIYARMHYWRSGTYHYQDTSFPTPTMTIAGETFYDTGFADWVHGGIDVGDVRTTTFAKTVGSNGTYGVSFSAGSGYRSDFAGSWSGSATVSSIVVAPNTPSISGSNVDSYANKITYGTSGFGNPSSGRVYLYGGTSPSPTTEIASKTSTGNSTFNHTGLKSNTKYYYRARVKNDGGAWSGYSSTITITTKPATFVPYPNDPNAENKLKAANLIRASNNGLLRKVTKLYDCVDGKLRRIF